MPWMKVVPESVPVAGRVVSTLPEQREKAWGSRSREGKWLLAQIRSISGDGVRSGRPPWHGAHQGH